MLVLLLKLTRIIGREKLTNPNIIRELYTLLFLTNCPFWILDFITQTPNMNTDSKSFCLYKTATTKTHRGVSDLPILPNSYRIR